MIESYGVEKLGAPPDTSGWWVARLLKADRTQQTALIFGLGMNNNGTGLVLASAALADHPRVMLPLIIYNLVQHLAAGAAAYLLNGGRVDPGRPFGRQNAEG
jgi:predicted Na+-dependent transporter